MEEHPFQPGVRVALYHPHGDVSERFIDKVHKNGNFTLRGVDGRWLPFQLNGVDWQARFISRHLAWDRRKVKVWDAEADRLVASSAILKAFDARVALEKSDPLLALALYVEAVGDRRAECDVDASSLLRTLRDAARRALLAAGKEVPKGLYPIRTEQE